MLPPHLDVRQGVVPCCPRHPLHGDSWDNDETLCVRKAEELARVLPTPGFIGVYPGIEDETWEKFVGRSSACWRSARALSDPIAKDTSSDCWNMRAQDTWLANKHISSSIRVPSRKTRDSCAIPLGSLAHGLTHARKSVYFEQEKRKYVFKMSF